MPYIIKLFEGNELEELETKVNEYLSNLPTNHHDAVLKDLKMGADDTIVTICLILMVP